MKNKIKFLIMLMGCSLLINNNIKAGRDDFIESNNFNFFSIGYDILSLASLPVVGLSYNLLGLKKTTLATLAVLSYNIATVMKFTDTKYKSAKFYQASLLTVLAVLLGKGRMTVEPFGALAIVAATGAVSNFGDLFLDVIYDKAEAYKEEHQYDGLTKLFE